MKGVRSAACRPNQLYLSSVTETKRSRLMIHHWRVMTIKYHLKQHSCLFVSIAVSDEIYQLGDVISTRIQLVAV